MAHTIKHALLDGDSDDIVRENYKKLKGDGFNEKNAWSIALKRASKGKSIRRYVKGVIQKPRKMRLRTTRLGY